MARYVSFVTPDERIRRLEQNTQREFQRKLRLDAIEKERADELQSQIEQEQARGAELDQVGSFNTQIEQERARGLELNKVERRQLAERRQRNQILDFREQPPPMK